MERSRRLLPLLALVAALVAPAAAHAYRVSPNIVDAEVGALASPASPAPGMNVGCKPSAAHPYPVVLVNGTFSVMRNDFGALAPTLANAGYCVYGFNYGYQRPNDQIQSIGPIPTSVYQLSAYVDQVRAATGAKRVDLVGHSQGGLLAEAYTKILGRADKVHSVVALSPTTHGTTLVGLGTLATLLPFGRDTVGLACPACKDQLVGSDVIKAVNDGPVTVPGVNYTVLETRYETVVTPVGSAFIQEPGVTNRYLQSSCANDLSDHVTMVYDQTTFRLVRNALDPSTAQSPNCWKAYPFPANL